MSSPAVIQESLVVTCIINAMEGRNVAITDITGAFIYTDMVNINYTVRVRLCGVLAHLLVRIDPSNFAENVVLEGGQKVIYAILKEALYGALIASLIFCQDLSRVLQS